LVDDVIARVVRVNQPVMVLGSSQPVTDINADISTVRRRSGGGAVWLDPAEQVSIDVLLPKSHSLWSDDITASFGWLGDIWAHTVKQLGVSDALIVHRNALERTAWSKVLCFAGRGPGEVFRGDRKLVGIAQRRSKYGALFQCGVLHRWTLRPEWFDAQARPSESPDRFGIGLEELGVQVTHDAVVDAFTASLGSRV
jgi:lipoate---protein ligase